MRICVFGASSTHIDDLYIKTVEELGEKLAKRGHSLVFGSGGTGLMGAAARGAKRGGAHICGVVPHFFKEENIEILFEECDETVLTETMRERKAVMEEKAEAFIVAPGGVGTFEEFFEILTLKNLGVHSKAIVLLNTNGYYDELDKFMRDGAEKRFVTEKCIRRYKLVATPDEALDYVENYVPTDTEPDRVKLGD